MTNLSTVKTKSEFMDEIKRLIVDDKAYKCMASVVFYANGVTLIAHGAPTPELEASMLLRAIRTFELRYREISMGQNAAAAARAPSKN
jgi:hypothetical protein